MLVPMEPRQGEPVYVAETVDPGPDKTSAVIALAVGVLVLLFQPRIFQWLLSKADVGTFTTEFSDRQGNPLAYPETVSFWGDLGIALFALALVTEGAVLLATRWKPALIGLIGLNMLVVLINLGAIGYYLSQGFALQFMLVLAAGFAAFGSWRLWQVAQTAGRRPAATLIATQ